MLILLAILYATLIWLIYFKLKYLPYDKKNKIISTSIGAGMILGIAISLLTTAPYSKDFFISTKINPIAPRVSGQVEKIFVEPGQIVNKGTPLLQLGTRSYDIKVKEAEGNLNSVKGLYEKAQKKRKIALNLQNANPESISELQLIDTEETLNQLRGQYEAAQSVLEEAKNDLFKTTVYAPADGFTPYIAFENETPVSAYTPIMSFISLSDLYPLANYSQNALSFVEKGDPVEFILDIYPGHIFSATVEEILWVAGEAQFYQGQTIPDVDSISPPSHFVVKLKATNDHDSTPMHFAAKGQVVIYTKHLTHLHIIQKVHLRMQSWLNYLAF